MTEKLPRLIEPEQLAPLLGDPDILLVDLSNPALYQQKHIPGAIHLPFQWLMAGTPPAPGKLPGEAQLQEVADFLGLADAPHIVLLDDEGGGWAGRLAWTLDILGYNHWSYLNGGMVAWIKEGYPVESEPVSRSPESSSIEINPESFQLDSKSLIDLLDDPQLLVWDARSYGEYCGDDVRAARGGHIPGAVHLEWTALMDPQRNLRIRENASEILDQLGITPDKKVVTHCQTHHRSSFTYMVARILGYPNIKAYDGSWSEWGNLEDTPIRLGPLP